eukprot:TRINITY_DN3209_c0_g3_i1.p1 TRINITY_DN3209_c0_g3~~TRINITY_DN3209_c0_g3_i1.p1  ORF type:complete len:543 (+),score=79.29 TRINITY_DN3209_c0_g3_i1:66-1694(+)
MRRGTSHRGKEGGTTLCVGVFLSVVFGLVYSYGAGQAKTQGLQAAFMIRQANAAARGMIMECKKEVMDATSGEHGFAWSGEEAEQLAKRNKAIEAESEDIYKQNNEWEQRSANCSERIYMLKKKIGEEAVNAKKLESLEATSRELIEKTRRLSGTNGMRTILLRHNLKRLAAEMNLFHKSLNMPVVDTNNPAFLDGLVAKWRGINSSKMNIGGTIMPQDYTEKWSSFTNLATPYDPDIDAKHIFFPTKTADGEYVIPGWLGRHGTQDLRHGTFVGSTYMPVSDINKQMRTLYDYAICAVGLNITKFMYPTSFKSCKVCPPEQLHTYIETPVVLFCDDCLPQHHSNEFKMLCQGYLDHEQYGSGLFWRARSRLRFKGRFMTAAEKWMAANDFGQTKNTLAVRIPRSEAFTNLCESDSLKETQAYTYLLKHKALDSGARDSKCLPPWGIIISTIKQYLERHEGHQVYVSTDCTEKEWTHLQEHIPVPLFRRHGTGKLSEDSVIDTFICAASNHLIVNRYDKKSTLIAEAFMLNNKLRTRNITVW